MKVTIRDKDALLLIQPLAVEKYLAAKGWIKTNEFHEVRTLCGEFKSAQWRKFGRETKIADGVDGVDFYEINFPLTRKFADYSQCVASMLSTLEKIENRSQLDIYVDLTGEPLTFNPTEDLL